MAKCRTRPTPNSRRVSLTAADTASLLAELRRPPADLEARCAALLAQFASADAELAEIRELTGAMGRA